MERPSLKEEYLAKAKLAEEEAAKATASQVRDIWLRVARDFRNLAAGING